VGNGSKHKRKREVSEGPQAMTRGGPGGKRNKAHVRAVTVTVTQSRTEGQRGRHQKKKATA
jgi:hypothetical protein